MKRTIRARCDGNNYVGDIFGSLGGKPDFGRGSDVENDPVVEEEAGVEEKGVVMRVRFCWRGDVSKPPHLVFDRGE